MSNAHVPASQDDFAQRVTQWFGWTHTFALSAALGDAPAPEAAASRATGGTDEQEYARVRDTLTARLAKMLPMTAEEADDFAIHRRHYITCQQAMETQIAPLRRRLRATLAAGSPVQAKLARLDGVMEEVVGVQERSLLATVPGLLRPRFDQLRAAHEDPAWLATFRQDMRALLLSELDLRLQPAQALLAAQRTPSSPSSDDRHG